MALIDCDDMSMMRKTWIALLSLTGVLPGREAFSDWKHSGSIFLLTTADGANLPASVEVRDFPVLVRLHHDFFPFGEAGDGGRDVRFSAGGESLAYEIEEWDREGGSASIWVRVPVIRGNERREMRIHWGNAEAHGGSDGKAVFNEANGYLGVWHLGEEVRDVVGRLESEDKGTTPSPGVIGEARRFAEGAGIFCGEQVEVLPSGGAPHTTQAWIRPETSNGRIVCWGNEKRAGKVTMLYRSPPGVRMDCYFSAGDVRADLPVASGGWTHAVYTYEDGQAVLYLNGERCGVGNPRSGALDIERPARMWIGGWYHRYDYAGEIDEVRLSGVARSADWVRLEYENQKPAQTLVGPVVQEGDAFAVTPSRITMKEGESVELSAEAGGAQKLYWRLVKGDDESMIATDRFRTSLNAGRVRGDQSLTVRVSAIYPDEVRSIDVPVTVKEALPEPEFTLRAPVDWDGREMIEVRPEILNREAMKKAGVGELEYRWEVSGVATIKDEVSGGLVLRRAQGSGPMTITLTLSNGGEAVRASAEVMVREPDHDAWVPRVPGDDERPVDGQFYARDDSGRGTMHCRGTLNGEAEEVFLRVYSDEEPYAEERRAPGQSGTYAFAVRLQPGLVTYRVELGTRAGGKETILHRAGDILCGDAYLIEGQSNALATDTREESPRVTNAWVRSYGRPQFYKEGERENLWCRPVWKSHNPDNKEYLAELGWWGMDLADRLVKSQGVPVFFLNGARGGTRIDQHQRNDENPTDPDTIYGRMLWRLQQARLTHGIRAVIWHQGESDQPADGPDGDYGWKTYQDYFVEMSADWKRDLPNLSRYYIFQIFPNACSMGNGNGNMLREVQRTLPGWFSNMEVLSTLGIQPPGGCHYPLVGWSEFAEMLQPLIERDFHGRILAGPGTPPNLQEARFSTVARDAVTLEFDQPVVWRQELAREFLFDGEQGRITSGSVVGNVLKLQLDRPVEGGTISYLDERSWSQERLLLGENGLAALTFWGVPVAAPLR